jgi:hypothetical protein
MVMAFLRGLGKAPTFLVPIINPPFADNSPHFFSHGTPDMKYHTPGGGGGLAGGRQSA